jgi:hypothetical protein
MGSNEKTISFRAVAETILFARIDQIDSDIMLVENFR